VYGPDADGTPADFEFDFALAAINTIRAQCNSKPDFKGEYPPVKAADVVIYDDECRSRVISGQRVITLSFDVPAATGSDNDVDGIYVLISTAEAVDDPDPAAVLNDVPLPRLRIRVYSTHQSSEPESLSTSRLRRAKRTLLSTQRGTPPTSG